MANSFSFDNNGIRIDHTTVTPRHSVTDEQSFNAGIEYLNGHGYAIFSDVLTEDEVNTHKTLLWEFFENIRGGNIRRDDPSTWSNNW